MMMIFNFLEDEDDVVLGDLDEISFENWSHLRSRLQDQSSPLQLPLFRFLTPAQCAVCFALLSCTWSTRYFFGIYRVFSLFLPIFITKIKKIMGSQSDSAFHEVDAEQQSS